MKALLLRAYNELVVEDVPPPTIGPSDVLVAVRACGICGSDVSGLDGSTGRRRPPLILGHEVAGEIIEVGVNVGEWRPGDRVALDSTLYCGKCSFCLQGRTNLCAHRRVLGVSCEEYRQDGAFCELVATPDRVLYRVPDALPIEHAALVEPVAVALHAIERVPLRVGDTAVVIGAGMIGLLLVQILRSSGCSRIVALDIEDSRLDVARKFGADTGVNPIREDPLAIVQALSDRKGAHVAFDAVGTGETLATALACVRKGGALTLIGNMTPRVDLALQQVVTREITLIGSCASAGEYPRALALMAAGRIGVKPLISAVAPLEEGPRWFGRLRKKEPGLLKVLLTPEATT
jgi:L-iditol 2-dehydrogenase